MSARSGSDAWVFAPASSVLALHWNGTAWGSRAQFHGWTGVGAAVSPAPGDAWAFGARLVAGLGAGIAAHYHGTRWVQMKFPVIAAAASATSAGDIWVIGDTPETHTSGPRPLVVHWNRRRWQAMALPHVRLPAGEIVSPTGIAVQGPRSVWAVATGAGVGPVGGAILYHWDGSAWHRMKIPFQTAVPAAVVPDGHGGIWLNAFDVTHNSTYTPSFFHDRNGHWTRSRAPARNDGANPVSAMSAIPGTRSVWAAGYFDKAAGFGGVIFKYGP